MIPIGLTVIKGRLYKDRVERYGKIQIKERQKSVNNYPGRKYLLLIIFLVLELGCRHLLKEDHKFLSTRDDR